MKNPRHQCKCLHCNELFVPNYRSKERQRFCSKADCQKARKQASQKAWLAKPENQNYFRDVENAARVRQWQKANPDYWRNSARRRPRTLQDACLRQTPANTELLPSSPARTLQELCSMHIPLFIGLISMWTGSTLQDDILSTARRAVAKGRHILGLAHGETYDENLRAETGDH